MQVGGDERSEGFRALQPRVQLQPEFAERGQIGAPYGPDHFGPWLLLGQSRTPSRMAVQVDSVDSLCGRSTASVEVCMG